MEPGYESFAELLRVCVYCLVYKGKVMYVGQSKQPLIRFYTHLKTKKSMVTPFGTRKVTTIPFDDIWMKQLFSVDADAEEKRLIQKYLPKYNIRDKREATIDIDMKALVKSLIPSSNGVHPTQPRIERRL